MTRTILCYGDSLTWGWIPAQPALPSARYPRDVRWPGVLAAELGDGYAVIEEGLSGRTTSLDDPLNPILNGRRLLPAVLASHQPVDLVVIMLGTNDAKRYFRSSALDIVTGAAGLLGDVAGSAGGPTPYAAPMALLVAPPLPAETLPDPWLSMLYEGARATLAEVRHGYRVLATSVGAGFFDAGDVITEVGVDGIHLTEQNNRDLASALARTVREVWEKN